ncbi:MAG: transketolase [Bacteroidetes bacterium B1(2017)]|nr:MAG: transketolase [Bacteroidetes bacterium B1(2017)]
MTSETEESLQIKIKSIKRRFLKMYHTANAGHIGSSLSCTELLTLSKFFYMEAEDKLVLSKGHAAASLYSVLAEFGEISEEQIATFYKNNTTLPAHPPVNKYPSIPFATGSLGHGLSIAAGFGFSSKLAKSKRKTFCITSDGELNEGSTWEAALFIQQQQLTNVIWLIDRNRLQGFGSTEEVMQLEPLDQKLMSFGFEVVQVNGHNVAELMALKTTLLNTQKPIAIIANTLKGNGWTNMEGKLGCHYLPMNDADYTLFEASLSN